MIIFVLKEIILYCNNHFLFFSRNLVAVYEQQLQSPHVCVCGGGEHDNSKIVLMDLKLNIL